MVGIAFFVFTLLMSVLLLFKPYCLDHLIDSVKILRQTTKLEGEDKSAEYIFILSRFIVPAVLIVSSLFAILITFAFRRWGGWVK
ncbi:MAG: hypothetical protein H6577_15840 [Lewinellaceae bacterium]|nr:hypothetical protein [Saprospiraceae bacterium]MCB9339600.1 hypothetical protein [Lewinellaceae bacterium]